MSRFFKHLFCIVAAFAAPMQTWAALSTSSVWEVRPTNGSDTNGGGYAWGGGSSIASNTDLAINAGNAAQVSSSGYGFTSSDVNRYLKITSGTGFTVGWYYITAVSSGTATLDRAAGTVSSTAGYFTVYYGIDYSRQNAANSSGSNKSTTDAVTNGTATITSATAGFTNDIVGNIIYIAGGTGSITGAWYQVTGYNSSSSITVDRSTGLTTGTGATMNIGGALQTMAKAAANYVGSNKIYVKAESTISTASSTTFSTSSSVGIPTQIIGYTSTRGDNGRVTMSASGSLSSGFLIHLSGNEMMISNFILNANSQTVTGGLELSGSGETAYNNLVENCSTPGIELVGNFDVAQNNEVTGCTGSEAIYDGGEGALVIGNYIHDNSTTGLEITTDGGAALYNIFYNNSGSSTPGILLLSYNSIVAFNTVDSSGEYGIEYGGSNVAPIFGNIISNTGYSTGTNAPTAYGLYGNVTNQIYPASPLWDGNAYYHNLTGNRHNMDDQGTGGSAPQVNNGSTPYTTVNDIALTVNPYNNEPTDFGLNNTAGGGALLRFTAPQITQWPTTSSISAPSFGAVQPTRAAVLPTVGYGG